MMAAKGALELYINLNLVLGVAMLAWMAFRAAIARTGRQSPHSFQFFILKALLVLVAASPLLGWIAAQALEWMRPGMSVVVSDLVVAAFLRGDLGSDAQRLETMLNARANWTDGFLTVGSPFFAILSVALLLGGAVAVVRVVGATLRLRHVLNDCHMWKRIGPVDLHLSCTARVPFAARGLFRRHVVVPIDLLAREDQRRMVLSHEIQHFRQGDLEWELAFELARPFFFWNPAFHVLRRQFERLRELTCDEAVLRKHRYDALSYARCLLDFCERSVGMRTRRTLGVALVTTARRDARTELANRLVSLKSIRGADRRTRPWVGMMAGMALALVIALVGATLQPPKDWSLDRLTLSTIVNLERFDTKYRGF